MDEHSPDAYRSRLLATLRLQYPDALADRGFRLLHPATSEPYTDDRRHLVATCRSIANFAVGATVDGPDWCLDAAEHGLAFLRDAHRAADGEGYRLVVDQRGDPIDRTRSAYGHAFVLLAYARATAAGIDGAESALRDAADLLDRRFRDETGLLRSDCDPDWTEREPYRGQNANMHACEAYLAAYEATGEARFLELARTIATRLTVDLAAETDGLLWEHYAADWEHDFEYNEDRPRHQFRPPGYQPGHHAEWAKFLALLDRYDGAESGEADREWYARAVELFDAAIDLGWTGDGFAYTVDAGGDPIVPDRYGWALAEAIGAAAALAERATVRGDTAASDRFRSRHRRFVSRAERYHGPAGLWYEKRTSPQDGNEPIAPDPPGVEPDYHPVSAWYESWRSADAVSNANRIDGDDR
ncbi:AGE family epimerase/isomerase [Halosolutus gelatinilyticus]|uniref:AGE family epimerase/isomerase n=1 Tax=Halosolutus gelatinilyticus TaxID=2931975 RepID=UPI001FF20345|nr:AGE family epimerase/isomerase [Halosolutus gelatinilyticus]